MVAYKWLIRRFLFGLPVEPETTHDWACKALRFLPYRRSKFDKILESKIAGLTFPNPVGLAAGFDKECRVFEDMYRFDFGSVEVGTITPEGQKGNPRPRITRLAKDNAIINRMGFPNKGLADCIERLKGFDKRPGPLGVNIGANKTSDDRIADYVFCMRNIATYADYVTINVSSPNTPGLRGLESGQQLAELLTALRPEIDEAKIPVFLKVSPDLDEKQIEAACKIIVCSNVSGVIVGNTTVSRPSGLKSSEAADTGGLSGMPLAKLSSDALAHFYRHLAGKLPIVSVGGIFSAQDAFERIKGGASLIQIYTAFIYEGPDLARQMNRELAALLKAEGYRTLSEAVGAGLKPKGRKSSGTSSENFAPNVMPALA